jgi:hypothetical protein
MLFSEKSIYKLMAKLELMDNTHHPCPTPSCGAANEGLKKGLV